MLVKKIYQSQAENANETIYQLENGIKIIKRDNEAVKKFNLNKWDEISFIPENFQEIKRNITLEEEKKIKEVVSQLSINLREKRSIWERMKQKWQTIFRR